MLSKSSAARWTSSLVMGIAGYRVDLDAKVPIFPEMSALSFIMSGALTNLTSAI
jgi:hypothetical protein